MFHSSVVKVDFKTGMRLVEMPRQHIMASRRTRGALIHLMALRARARRPTKGTRAPNTGWGAVLNLLQGLFVPRKPVLHG